MNDKNLSIGIIGNYAPRQCGIATFTTDLCNAISKELNTPSKVAVVAMDDIPKGYPYPEDVCFQVRANVQTDYFWAAKYLNVNKFNVAIVQHEYGIFGGECGVYLLDLMRNLQMPILTTLHTVLKEPKDKQKFIIQELARLSEKLIIMSHKAIDLLVNVYGIDRDCLEFIPHGIPDVSFLNPGVHNKLLGIKGDIILSFGLLNEAKGIEYMIEAMPSIIKENTKAVYVILGETHPHVKEMDGDAYRNKLILRVKQLGLNDNVIFHNHFVKLETLTKFLQSAHVYITPYISKEQITSGTLAYALGCGVATVSTPYWYAEELLSGNRGKIVPFYDYEAMAKVISELLKNKKDRKNMRRLAYNHGRSMIWSKVAGEYINAAISTLEQWNQKSHQFNTESEDLKIFEVLPEIQLEHLKILTDSTGIFQHAIFSAPNWFHGYCTDDNARALIVVCKYYDLFKDKTVMPFITKYFSFLFYAFNQNNNYFRNFMSFERNWLEEQGSEDSHARAVLALGEAVKYAPRDSIRNMALRLFHQGLEIVEGFTSPRAWAFAIIGIHSYLEVYSGDANVRRVRAHLADKLFNLYKQHASDEWPWFEDKATYANAKLCHALLLSGQWIPNDEMFAVGLKSLEWLMNQQIANGQLSIIGNENWFHRNGEKSDFDQQPIEAMCLVEACAHAYKATGDKKWLRYTDLCLGWFLGQNHLNTPLYDFETGGCCDGLQPYSINANQGAESTLACLISLLTMYETMGEKAMIDKQIE